MAERLVGKFLEKKQTNIAPPRYLPKTTSDIAVIGLACYYPGASNIRELWENILARRIQFRRILDQRFPLKEYYDEDPKSPEKTYVTKAAFLENFRFDWSKLRIPKKTFESTDVSHWLALDTALKAFEDTGYAIADMPVQNTGVIVGNTLTGEQTRSQLLRLRWPYVQKVLDLTLAQFGVRPEDRDRVSIEMERSYKSAFYPITEDSLAGGLANTIAGRICNYLNLKGGGYVVDGACSSSLLAVATAANALKMGELALALAGGVDVSLDPFELVGFAKAGALAKDKMSVYDRQASGFLPGEGCGFVVLKRLEDALRDHNYIYAVIRGWGISSDGKGGIMEPSSSGQALAIRRAYANTDYKVSGVDFIEGHGTGTAKGDRVELEGIATAIEECKRRDEAKLCGVTSFKSIVGHTKAAAGVGSFIKAVLAVNQRILPPTAGCKDPNEFFREKAKRLYPIVWGESLPQNKVMRAGISSAGFGGINCHVTIESAGEPSGKVKPTTIDERSLLVSDQETEIFVFSARTLNYLRNIILRFKEDLRNISFAEMADLAALINRKAKGRLPMKGAIVTDSPEHLYEALVLIEKELTSLSLSEGSVHRIQAGHLNTHIVIGNNVKRTRIGFLYPGQGSQYLNMTRRLVERFKWARNLLELPAIPLSNYIYQPTERLLDSEDQREFERKLAETWMTQPAVATSSLIWTKYLSQLGVEPQAAGGHSLGELMAFYRAGALSEATLIKFAEFRGKLMMAPAESSGGMFALSCSAERTEELIRKVGGAVGVANINSPHQTVVSGAKREIAKVVEIAKKENIQAYRLNVSNAFHSSFMHKVSERLRTASFLQGKFRPNGIDLYSCMDGQRVASGVGLGEYFARQVLSKVNFAQLVQTMSRNCDILLEVGPGRVLTDLVAAINRGGGVPCLPVESTADADRDLNVALAELFVRNIQINWEELYRNRLIRPFVQVSRKHFITNQCERPLQIEHTEPTTLEIKTKEQATNVGRRESSGTAEAEEGAIAERQDDIASLLVDLTQRMTGFDKGSISLELRLLDDLNLDSIKAAELTGEAARILGVAGHLDPSQLWGKTLGQIRDRLQELVSYQGSRKTAAPIDQVFKRYQRKTWVRNFSVEFEQQEIVAGNTGRLNEFHNVLILSEGPNQDLAQEIKKHFSFSRAQVRSLPYSDIPKKGLDKFSDIDCAIFILPTNAERSEFDEMALKQIIDTLHTAISLSLQSNTNGERIVAFVQYGYGTFGDHDFIRNIGSCCARAIASTLHLERPSLRVRIIDVDERSPKRDIAVRIVDELKTTETFSAVGYDYQLKRQVPVYKKSEPAHYKRRNIKWSEEDVVLVSGGAKGITAECAFEFARSTGARMILVGRSPNPTNLKDEGNEIVKTLTRFKEAGLKCHYHQCDITDRQAVNRFVSWIRGKFGRIKGLIHGAGLNSLRRLGQVGVEEAYAESLPKVIGALNILGALGEEPPLFIMAITSVIGVTGMEGSGWYGFANEVLNLCLRKFGNEHAGTQVQTIAYSIWDELGMGVRLGSLDRLSEKGIAPIPVKEGIKRFKQLVEHDAGVQQLIVVARIGGMDTWRSPRIEQANGSRFIEDIKYFLPGVELIAQAHLNVQEDPYLLDHNWKGSLLFPLVFGLEAMAQAVAYLTNRNSFGCLKIRDITLERPILVGRDLGTTIEIHAEVLEEAHTSDCLKVRVEIYSEPSNYQQPHFSAIFEMDRNFAQSSLSSDLRLKAEKIIGLDMETDVYGPVLFQGKMFQCIKLIHELYYDHDKKIGNSVLTSTYNKSTGEFLERRATRFNNFLIGDPFFIDSILQSMQLIVAQENCVPREIEKIELILPAGKEKRDCFVSSSLKKISTNFYRGDSYASADQFSLQVINCRLKILSTNPKGPSASDLVNPTSRDQKIIDETLSRIASEFKFTSPVIKCASLHDLKDLENSERHRIELPVMREAVLELLNRKGCGTGSNKIKIGWSSSGKPVVKGRGLDDIGISISHKQNFVICATGQGSQGCDLEIIAERDRSKWKALLGKENSSLLDKWQSVFDDLNVRGTAVWSAVEAVKKAKNIEPDFEIEHIGEGWVVLKVLNANNSFVIVTLVKFTTLKKSILSFYQENMMADRKVASSDLRHEREIFLKKFGFDEDAFGIQADNSGPQGQFVFTKQFTITFRSNNLLISRVLFTRYFEWMGELREYSVYPIKDQLTDMLESGVWGIATNWVKHNVIGDLRANDVVEGRVWMEEVSGQKESTFDLCFDWRRNNKSVKSERVAFSRQRVTWVRVIGRGRAAVEEIPEAIKFYMDSMKPKFQKRITSDDDIKLPKHLSRGQPIKSFMSKKTYLIGKSFETSLENSNLVGNIYFANYAKWLGVVTDLYFYQIIPEFYRGTAADGEFISTACEVNHLSEAMPFDNVLVEMFVNRIYEKGLDFEFEFFLFNDNHKGRKLAAAKQELIWVKRNEDSTESSNLPQKILQNFLTASPVRGNLSGVLQNSLTRVAIPDRFSASSRHRPWPAQSPS